MEIKDQVFVVTGAGSGLGAATAEMLVEGGGRVVLVDINLEACEQTGARLGHQAKVVQADVTSEDSAKNAVEIAAAWGNIRGLVNCAGIAPARKLLGKGGVHSLADFAKTVSINLIGTFNMTRLAADAMSRVEPQADGERGVIVNTASVAAYEGQVGQIAYSASKGGVAAMTLPLARELSRHGVRVMTIAPGIMETPMLLGMPPEVQASLGAMVPFPSRLGRAAEYAALVAHIFKNTYLNGEVIRLDAAIRMAAR